MEKKTFTAVLHKEENMYVAECPEIGVASQGYTIEEALANLKEATELYLEEFPLNGKGQDIYNVKKLHIDEVHLFKALAGQAPI